MAINQSTTEPALTEHPFNHPLLSIWLGLIARCNSPAHPAFKHYGGRGIRVCERWMDFRAFVEDIGPRPTPQHSVERNDVNKGYAPYNCRWATATEQARNTRRTRWMTFNGRTMALSAWAEESVVCEATIRSRIRRGWPLALALATAPKFGKRVIQRPTYALCAAAGISYGTFAYRMSKGLSEHDALHRPVSHKRLTRAVHEAAAVSPATISRRCKRGWTIEEALRTPPREKPLRLDPNAGQRRPPKAPHRPRRVHAIAFHGESLPITHWAKRIGIHPATLFARLKGGWTVERALSEPTWFHRPVSIAITELSAPETEQPASGDVTVKR